MIHKVAEEHHHTLDEVERYLRGARVIVENCGFNDDLRAVAFSKAVDLLSAKQMWHEQGQLTMAAPSLKRHG